MIEIISHPGLDRSVTLEELYDYQDAEGSVTQNGNENDAFCSSVGLTSSAAINMFSKAVLREKRCPIFSFFFL